MIDDSILFMEDNNKIEHETEKIDTSASSDTAEVSSVSEVIEEQVSDDSVSPKEKEIKAEVIEGSVSEEASGEEISIESSEEPAYKSQSESSEETFTEKKTDKEEPIEKSESSEEVASDEKSEKEERIEKAELPEETVSEEKSVKEEPIEKAELSEENVCEEKSDKEKPLEKTELLEEKVTEEKADTEEKTESEPVEEPKSDNASDVSTKPQAVLDELEKLKSSNHEEENKTTDDSAEKSVNKEKETSAEAVVVVTSSEVVTVEAVPAETDKVEADKVETDPSKVVSAEPVSVENIPAEPLTAKDTDNSEKAEDKDFSTAKKWYLSLDFWKSFAFDVFFLILCVLFIFILGKKWFSMREVIIKGTSQVHSSLESGEKTTIGNINILVMGIDSVEGTHRSDTIFVLGVNPSKGKITMLSIPRDTRVIIEDKGRKINEILPRYGEPTLRKILEELLKINISRKVEVGFESFVGIIDAIGGVDINIEKPMHYDDNWGNLHIHFNPGMNHLDGQDALRYVRFRKDAMADLGRIKRQQDFVKAVLKKVFSPKIIVKLPSVLEKAFEYIKTDFTLQEILTLAKGFDTFDVKLRALSLPGEARYIDKISFFVPYSEEAVAIGDNYFSDLAIFEIEKDYILGKAIPKQSKSNRKNK